MGEGTYHSLTIGSFSEWCSNIIVKHYSMFSNHGKECADVDKSKTLNFSDF